MKSTVKVHGVGFSMDPDCFHCSPLPEAPCCPMNPCSLPVNVVFGGVRWRAIAITPRQIPYQQIISATEATAHRLDHRMAEALRLAVSAVKAIFKPQSTLKQLLVKVKQKMPEEKKKEVVYQVLCKDCSKVYTGEIKRTLKTRISEHKQAVKKGDEKNGIVPIPPATTLTGREHGFMGQHGASGRGEQWKQSGSVLNPTP